jgi:hypothetical protein
MANSLIISAADGGVLSIAGLIVTHATPSRRQFTTECRSYWIARTSKHGSTARPEQSSCDRRSKITFAVKPPTW